MEEPESQRLQRWIVEKWKQRSCPVCTANQWTLDPELARVQLHDDARASYPVLVARCLSCGYMLLINAVFAGIADPEPASPPPPAPGNAVAIRGERDAASEATDPSHPPVNGTSLPPPVPDRPRLRERLSRIAVEASNATTRLEAADPDSSVGRLMRNRYVRSLLRPGSEPEGPATPPRRADRP